jgi:hypothetical protein
VVGSITTAGYSRIPWSALLPGGRALFREGVTALSPVNGVDDVGFETQARAIRA